MNNVITQVKRLKSLTLIVNPLKNYLIHIRDQEKLESFLGDSFSEFYAS